MATGYEFLMNDFANWQPNTPEAQDNQPVNTATGPDYGAGYNVDPTPFGGLPIDATNQDSIDYWGADGGAAAQAWAAVMLPYMQMQSNTYESNRDFGEAQNRFWQQLDWTQGRDVFNMDLASRQQSSQEQQALWQQGNFQDQLSAQAENDAVSRDVAGREMTLAEQQSAIQSGQWSQSFAAQAENDAHARQMADQRLSFEEDRSDRQLDQAERQQLWQEEYGRARIEADREASRYAAFGRSQAPSGSWIANWG